MVKSFVMQDLSVEGARSKFAAFLSRDVLKLGYTKLLRSMIRVSWDEDGCLEGEENACEDEEEREELKEAVFNAFDPPLNYGFDLAPHFGFYSAFEFDEDQFRNFGEIRI